jgi:hypothetical protein
MCARNGRRLDDDLTCQRCLFLGYFQILRAGDENDAKGIFNGYGVDGMCNIACGLPFVIHLTPQVIILMDNFIGNIIKLILGELLAALGLCFMHHHHWNSLGTSTF